MVGSTEFEWQHPALAARDDAEQLRAYLKELAGAGAGWEFAPAQAHSVRAIAADQTVTEAGKQYPSWEIEGTALFAADAGAFLDSLPACLERQSAPWTDLPGSGPA
jgi:hypothetical protein